MGRPSKTSVQATSKERKLFKEKKMAQKRKGLTLDLNAAAGVGPSGHGIFSKKSKLAASHILTSPDVQKLKLSSPELAEFLTRNPTLATPTPSGGNHIFPKTVTEEQESYVKGFEVALKNLQQHPGQAPSGQGSVGHQIPIDQKYIFPKSIITDTPTVVKHEPHTRTTSIETIEKATAAHRASKLAPVEVSPRPESSASGSMDSSELRIKEEIEDADLDDDFDAEDDSYSDDEESVKSPPKKRGCSRK